MSNERPEAKRLIIDSCGASDQYTILVWYKNIKTTQENWLQFAISVKSISHSPITLCVLFMQKRRDYMSLQTLWSYFNLISAGVSFGETRLLSTYFSEFKQIKTE